jgi:hypothetical protein
MTNTVSKQYRNRFNKAIELIFVAFTLCTNNPLFAQNPEIEQRIFTSGKWVKLEFNNSEVYKVTYNDLKNWGFNPNNIDPRDIHFYAIQGSELELINRSKPSNGHAPEIPIQVFGEEDGVFDPADYILIFKESTRTWKWVNNQFRHVQNKYTDISTGILGCPEKGFSQNKYPGLRIANRNFNYDPNSPEIKNFKYLHFHDSNMVNPQKMGTMWLGEKLGNETLKRSFNFNLPPSMDSVQIKLGVGGAMIEGTGSLKVTINGNFYTIPLRRISTSDEACVLIERFYTIVNPGSNLSVQLELVRPNSQSFAHLDFIEILGDVNSVIPGNRSQTLRLQPQWANVGNVRYSIPVTGFASDYLIWDVSNAYEVRNIQGFQSNSSLLNVSIPADSFVSSISIFQTNSLSSPKKVGDIALKTLIKSTDKKNVYIVPNSFQSFLNANLLKAEDFTVTIEDIYTYYGGGQADIRAIRNYIRDQHLQNGGLNNIILVGSTSFDPKNRVKNNTNLIPIYHSNGQQITSAYCLDDFFGYLMEGQGDPEIGRNSMTVPVGRIPVRNIEELTGFWNKLKLYGNSKSLGAWRNKLAFVADDIDASWEAEFTMESENYVDYLKDNHPTLKVEPIYADAFKQITNGNNEAYPSVTEAIRTAFEKGSLFVNYQGHGGEKGWAQESFLDIPFVKSLRNLNNQPILFTATCEFSRYDDPELQSAGELTMLNPDGGAIALMTTTRKVWVAGNSLINDAFWKQYGFPKPNEPVPTLGQIYQRLKNRPSPNSEDNKFALLGDPSMKLAFPEHVIQVDSVNGIAASEFTDTIKAFSVVRVKGHVNERLKGILSGFNGVLEVEVLDKPVTQYTLNNDGKMSPLPFSVEKSYIFKGSVNVVNGRYEFSFSVPKDIAYNIALGRMLMYAQNGVTDAAGYFKFLIGGSEIVSDIDTVGPQVKCFMQDTFFKQGDNVLRDVDFVARIYDLNGINSTGSGIGRDLMITLDPETENEQFFVVNEYFTFDKGSYTQGTLKFPMTGISPGKHTIKCVAWDIFNNSGEGKVEFNVVPGRQLLIPRNGAFPVPCVLNDQSLNVWVEHNLAGEDIKVHFDVYNFQGSKVHGGFFTEMMSSSRIQFEPMKDFNHFGGSTFYIVRVTLETSDGLKESTSIKVMVTP